LIVHDFNCKKCYEFAINFFGTPKVSFAAIDGTEYAREIFDLVIFFGGAYACTGEIEFKSENKPIVRYSERIVEEGQSISSCVPLYINEVPEVDQTFFEEKEGEIALGKSLKDEEIIDNSQISFAIMHFAEYFLAYSILKQDKNVKVILMDRTLSGDQASLISKTSKKGNWEKRSSLIGFEVNGIKVTSNLLEYGRYRICNPNLDLPPARGDYLKYRILYLIEEKGSIDLNDILKELKIEDRKERVERILDYLEMNNFIKENNGFYEIENYLKNAWPKLKMIVEDIGKRIFKQNKLQIEKDGKEHWLTTLDLSFLTLFCFNMLIEECGKNNVLLIGITKDTSAKDFKNHFIPICQNNRVITYRIDQKRLSLIPNTDRMFLQSTSLLNPDDVIPPWSLIEYDSAFKTLVQDEDLRYMKGAIRNKISPERFFLKSYIQLVKARSDPKLRSNVFAIDRLAYKEDIKDENIFTFKNKYGKFEEPVSVIIYRNKTLENEIQNMNQILKE
jgi:hypothetical protein